MNIKNIVNELVKLILELNELKEFFLLNFIYVKCELGVKVIWLFNC